MCLLKKGCCVESQSPSSRQRGLYAESNGFSSRHRGPDWRPRYALCREHVDPALGIGAILGPLVSSVPRAESTTLGTEVGPTSNRGHLTPRLCQEPPTGSRQQSLLCRELFPRLSAQRWGPQLTPSAADGPVTKAKWALSTAVPRVGPLALGRAASAGPVVPGALCRELRLGTGCAESNQLCAKRIALSAEVRIPVVLPVRAPAGHGV
jgi:hypothetical protein